MIITASTLTKKSAARAINQGPTADHIKAEASEQSEQAAEQSEQTAAQPTQPAEQSSEQPAEQSPATSASHSKPTAREPLNSHNYFPAMQQLLYNCQHDSRLSPAAILVYRTLAALANKSYWQTPFVAPDSELKQLTHLTRNGDLTTAKRTLKNLGYIDFYGKPSHYSVYTPPVHKPRRNLV